ncbi:fumarylacetoacetate hydrolase family protein [Subtercola sp. YIM 133946]|uniref:fumarylacetoacetate hydrolase family protein n=1 Tax=Subtercola sp. YIM 133946 TaxID=3118909 RepID=UPI002F927BC7
MPGVHRHIPRRRAPAWLDGGRYRRTSGIERGGCRVRICRFTSGRSAPSWGIVENDLVFELTGDPYDSPLRGELVGALSDVSLLAPTVASKVVCAARNYRTDGHVQSDEPAFPVLFGKYPNSIIGPDAPIEIPTGASSVSFEGELAVIISRLATAVQHDDAKNYIAGYTCANDVTVSEWMSPEPQWLEAKSSDTLCPLGPWMETELDTDSVRIRTSVNGESRQDGTTAGLIFTAEQIVVHITKTMTLYPGDVILTGTPAGVGKMYGGDVVEVQITGLGTLRNPVICR